MSQLSEFFKHKRYLIEEIVNYLETHADNLSGPEKAAIVVAFMKQLHISTGGLWGALIEQALLTAIDYELSRIREHPPKTPPVVVSIYYTPHPLPLPSDAELLGLGYKSGDVKWTSSKSSQWMVTETGGLGPAGWDQMGMIG